MADSISCDALLGEGSRVFVLSQGAERFSRDFYFWLWFARFSLERAPSTQCPLHVWMREKRVT